MQNTIVEIESSSASGAVDNQMFKTHQPAQTILPAKRKRNLPGMPDPDSEVIALSPKTLLATNRFVCEICNKGFQRDQNLQLHRRGHNLPWKLKQRSGKEAAVRKRVYVCPEAGCVHHDPSRALGDLTGIKKHFCRKHGEKKHKCERCNKKYAVRSDWKAHMKTCGTREYPCDCGTLFSRRDSFITHRAFCDALAQESARSQPPSGPTGGGGDLKVQAVAPVPPAAATSPPPPPLTPSTSVLSPVLSIQSSATELADNQIAHLQPPPPPPPPQGPAALTTSIASTITATIAPAATTSTSSTSSGNIPSTGTCFAGVFNSSTSELPQSSQQPASYPSLLCAMSGSSGHPTIDPMSLSLSSPFYGPPSLFPPTSLSRPQPALSATALLQKAAQLGATSSNSSFLRGLRLAQPSSSDPQHNASALHWNNNVKIENNSLASGLGLSSSGSSGFNKFMMGPSTFFGDKPATTLDFLGLGMGGGESSSEGFSAFLSSISGGLNVVNAAFGGTWDDSSDQKPSIL